MRKAEKEFGSLIRPLGLSRRILRRIRMFVAAVALRCLIPLKELSCRLHRLFKHSGFCRKYVPEVLLVASSPLELFYLIEVGDVLQRNFTCRVVFATKIQSFEVASFRKVSLSIAKWRWWDLIVFADHHPLEFPISPPSMCTLHGLVRSRVVAGGSYQYDRKRVLRRGQPVYSVMIDVSDEAVEWARNHVPEIADRIRVGGDLKVDRLLLAAKSQALSPAAPSKVLFVMSTWGPHSLMEAHGIEVVSALEELVQGSDWKVIISTHPNLWRVDGQPWQRSLRTLERIPGIEVLTTGTDWVRPLSKATVVLSDHTSLNATYAVLRRPIVLAPILSEVYGKDTFAALLYDNCPIIGDWSNLCAVIDEAALTGMPLAVQDAVERIVTHPGKGEELLVDFVREILSKV